MNRPTTTPHFVRACMRRQGLAAIALLLLPGAVRAQERTVKYDLEHVFRDGWFIVSAPSHASRDDWQTALALAGVSASLLLVDEPLHGWLERHPRSGVTTVLSAFGESSVLNIMGRTPEFLMPLSVAL